MKRIFLIVIISLAWILLTTSSASVPGSNTAIEQKGCDCSNLKALQAELRNAIKLQQAFRNKIAELRQMNQPTSASALEAFAKGEARRGLEPVPDYNGPKEVDYDNNGSTLYDPQHPGNTFNAEQLCEMTSSATNTLNRAIAASACAGIGEALRAHEAVHKKSCLAKGFVTYFNMHGADRAQEEVEAYGAQIAVLRAEIAKVLQKADVHVIVDVNTRMQMPSNPLYSAINITNHADIPMSRVTVTNDYITMLGEGKQETNGSIEGSCRFTSGLPSYLPAHANVETDGTDAKVSYSAEGTSQSMSMECQIGGKTGRGMSFPVPIKGDNKGDFTLVFENGATKEFDQGSGQAAQILASGGAKMSGKGIVKLVFCNSGK